MVHLRSNAPYHPNDEFFFFFDRAFDQRFIFAKNVTPIILFPPARHPFLFVAWYEAALTNALRRYNCDVFWSPDNFLSLQTLTPTVLTVHDLAYKAYPEQVSFFVRQYYQYFTPRYLRKAKNILTVSQFVKPNKPSDNSLRKVTHTFCTLVPYNHARMCCASYKPLNYLNNRRNRR